MAKPLEQALTEKVRETFGVHVLQILQLEVQVERLAAENVALTAENAELKAAVAPLAEAVT